MDNENQTPENAPQGMPTEYTAPNEVAVSEFSTTRRTVAAVLVLVAALLLGYVLYNTLLSSGVDDASGTDAANPEPEIVDGLIMNPGPEPTYTDAELQALIESQTDQPALEVVYDEETDTYSTVESENEPTYTDAELEAQANQPALEVVYDEETDTYSTVESEGQAEASEPETVEN